MDVARGLLALLALVGAGRAVWGEFYEPKSREAWMFCAGVWLCLLGLLV